MRYAIATLWAWLALGTIALAAEPQGYEIITCSFRTGDLELFAVDPVSGDARNLTRSPNSTDKYPGCSFDGTRIAFISDREGGDGLYVMDADGSNVRRLAKGQKGNAGMPSWTADGHWIYFGLYAAGPDRMCRIRPDGSEFQVVAEGIDPAISPDGKTLAFAKATPEGHHLFAMNADGSNVRQLTKQANGFGGVHATWTPDGKFLIFANQVGESLELFRCGPDGQDMTQLTHFGGGRAATSPAVSPDGQWITFRLCDEVYWRSGERSELAYKERRADKRPVWIMGRDGSNPHVIEPLHYQTTIDGSRAPFRKRK
jgi:TolB protein